MAYTSLERSSQFWNSFIEDENGCWIWQNGKRKGGYGKCHYPEIANLLGNSCSTIPTHRISYVLYYQQPIPKNMQVMHICDNPPCINPLHLRLGTTQDNTADSTDKGRRANGEKNNRVKLTEGHVIEMRRLYLDDDWSLDRLSNCFGVLKTNVGQILDGITWDHCYDPDQKSKILVKRRSWRRRAKLTHDQTAQIRALAESGMKNAAIARQYGVSRTMIGYIVNRKWHVN